MSQKNKYLYNGKELQNNEFGTKGFGIYEHITLAYNTGKACNIYSTEAQPSAAPFVIASDKLGKL